MQTEALQGKTVIQSIESVKWIKNEMAIRLIEDWMAIRLIEDWMADQSGYDETIWGSLKKSIEDNRLSERKKFDE